jgi:hypothetical protein
VPHELPKMSFANFSIVARLPKHPSFLNAKFVYSTCRLLIVCISDTLMSARRLDIVADAADQLDFAIVSKRPEQHNWDVYWLHSN